MTVKELIKKLNEFDENLEVAIFAGDTEFCLDDSVFHQETWHKKDGKDVEWLGINFD